MEHQFDRLAKSVAGTVSRRQALWRIAKALGVSLLAATGLAAARRAECEKCCATLCRTLYPPPRGREMAICITTCLETGTAVGADGIPAPGCEPFCTDR